MENDNYFSKVGETATDAADYVRLQLDRFKLRMLDNFSTLLSAFFSTFLIVLLSGIALVFLAGAFVIALGEWINSQVWAFMIVAGIFILAVVILFIFRQRLFVDGIVRLLSRIMFETDKKRDDGL